MIYDDLRKSVLCSGLTPQTYVEFNNSTIAAEKHDVSTSNQLDLQLGIQLGVVLLGCPVCVSFSIEIRRISELQELQELQG